MLVALFALGTTSGAQTTVDLYRKQDSAAAAARKAGDWNAYRDRVLYLDSILNGHPNVRVVKARIYAHLGDTASAYSSLRDLAAMGLVRKIDADTDLVTLRGTPQWNEIIERLASNAAPAGSFAPAFSMPDSDFIAEDVTWDPAGSRWFVSGIRRSVIVAVDHSGHTTLFAQGNDTGRGFLALAVDSVRNVLWATTEAIPQAIGFDTTIAGHASLFKYELKTGKLLQRYDMPATEAHGAGDIAVAENGDLYIADTGTGSIYVIRHGGALEQLVKPGEFMSPQGPAVARDGKHFYISDYARGIARVDRATGTVEWVRHDPTIAINGIDGISVLDARTLIAVQNGTNPNRVIRIALDPSGLRAVKVDVLAQNDSKIHEPTHGVLVGRDYYFIANGGYGAFGDDGKLRAGERAIAPVVMKISNVR
jgi:sugar lactone lactonase YvrE